MPNLLLQKFPAEEFTATAKLRVSAKATSEGAVSGLVVMGWDYSALGLEKRGEGFVLRRYTCRDHRARPHPNYECDIWLRVRVGKGALCRFSYSTDGRRWHDAGSAFTARQGKWIGAKTGMFSIAPATVDRGWMDIDEFTVEP